jgi:hypothetical protein
VAGREADEDGHLDLPGLPLYPAAKVLVRPVFANGRLSVGHRWVIGKEDQPDWVAGFRQGMGDDKLLFERLHWLKLNEKQPIYVPAGLRFGLEFTAPYDEKWTAVGPRETLLLGPGEEADIGDVTFLPSPRITVTVLDDKGKPIEGIPLRRKHDSGGPWCVAHNTDANGEARFFSPAGSSGKVAVRDFPDREAPEAKQPNLTVSFQIGEDGKLASPCVIRLTAKQRDLILGGEK